MEQPTQDAILQALKNVEDPDLGRDIVSLGFVQNLAISAAGEVAFTLELTTPACPMKDALKKQAHDWAASVPGVKKVDIHMTSRVRSVKQKEKILPDVKNIILIASGKGGVGKSTLSVNLALALAQSGARVGIMDADIYGPSIPNLLGVVAPEASESDRHVSPAEKYGLKIMSMGFFLPADKAAIWRGPMLHQMIGQFLTNVAWGELDYLLIDMPPGTGDAYLSVCQMANVTGAVVVSTPQDVALNVAQKAIFMLNRVNCPILGIVENMSYHLCPCCGARDNIFGSGGARAYGDKAGIPFLGEVPLNRAVREDGDQGVPALVTRPDAPHAGIFREIAQKLAAQVSLLHIGTER